MNIFCELDRYMISLYDEWDKCLGMDGTCYGKVGSIRSKLAVGGYTLVIERAKTKK